MSVISRPEAAATPSHATKLAYAVMQNILGQRDAQHLLFALQEDCAPADALHDALQQVLAAGDADRTRAFCRELQKRLERIGGVHAG